MRSLEDLLKAGGTDKDFAVSFIKAHGGKTSRACGCWKREVRTILNVVGAVSTMEFLARTPWAEKEAKDALWGWAELGGCGAPGHQA
jgi:hypothetical protein